MIDFADERSRMALEADLQGVLAQMEDEELQLLSLLARRLLEGQRRYGALNLAADRRNLEAERGEELADALVYGAMAELQRLLRSGDVR